jgi:flagellar hook-length control protein FliK
VPAGGDAPVAAQLGRHIAVLRNAPNGSQTMTVVITPESLGPVTVSVTVTDGTLDLTLHGAHEAGRHALRDALPELRRELEGAGLSFNTLEVDTSSRDAGASLRNTQQQLLDARAGQQGFSGQPGQQDSRTRAWGAAPGPRAEDGAALTTDQSTSSGVDVRV